LGLDWHGRDKRLYQLLMIVASAANQPQKLSLGLRKLESVVRFSGAITRVQNLLHLRGSGEETVEATPPQAIAVARQLGAQGW
jgi:hypothetical protein